MDVTTVFNADELSALLSAPAVASAIIALASPSGPIGTVKEATASATALAALVQTPVENELLAGLGAYLKAQMDNRDELKEQMDLKLDPKDPELKAKMFGKLGALNEALTKVSAEDAAAYKQWTYTVAVKAAEAGKEGAFLGIGGVKVSDEEKAALAEIAKTLGIEA